MAGSAEINRVVRDLLAYLRLRRDEVTVMCDPSKSTGTIRIYLAPAASGRHFKVHEWAGHPIEFIKNAEFRPH